MTPVPSAEFFVQNFLDMVSSSEVRFKTTSQSGAANVIAFPEAVLQLEDGNLSGRRVPAPHYVRVDSATALVGDTSEQAMFAAGNDALTVEAATTYRFRCVAALTTGATSVTVSFSLNGTATFTTSFAISHGIDAASGTAAAAAMNNSVALGTAFVVCAAGTGVNKRFMVEGEFEVNAAGTIIPSVTFSADPQGTETVNVGSFFECWPVGGTGLTAIGNWA